MTVIGPHKAMRILQPEKEGPPLSGKLPTNFDPQSLNAGIAGGPKVLVSTRACNNKTPAKI